MANYPNVLIREESLRDGLQVEDAAISSEARIGLLDRLSDTGLKDIVIGSFVSPRYTPQMAHTEAVAAGFTPKPGVRYSVLVGNERGRQRAAPFGDKIAIANDGTAALPVHMCDIFVRRNWNRSQAEEIAAWPVRVADAKARGIAEARLWLGAPWGSNFTGPVSLDAQIAMLERQHAVWDAAGIAVTGCAFADPMSWNMPHLVEQTLDAIRSRWPGVTTWHLHLHDGRGMAMPSIYAALRVLGAGHTLELDAAIGGIGGCPYCGNGRAAGMAPTEDLVHMLDGMGIETGIDLDKLIEAAWLLEEMLGRPTMGHVSKAGPRPGRGALYDPNMPFVETFEQAKHFLKGPDVYAGGAIPWTSPIVGDQRGGGVHPAGAIAGGASER